MIGTPWWASVIIGVVTVVGAGIAAWIGASRTTEATKQGRPLPRGRSGFGGCSGPANWL